MPNQLSVFQFQSSYDVRIQLINNELYFCLKYVCLSLDIKNTSQLASQLDEKGISKTYPLTKGGHQNLIFVNEPNLYRIIFRSNKPDAKQFQDWVFNDVLPTIRKNGKYSVLDQSEWITPKQLNNLKTIVHNISNAYFYRESFTQGVWKMIRDVTGVDSVQHIRKEQLHLIKPQIEKMLVVTNKYHTLRQKTESEIVKKIFRDNKHQDSVISGINDNHKQFILNLNNENQIYLDKFEQKLLANLG